MLHQSGEVGKESRISTELTETYPTFEDLGGKITQIRRYADNSDTNWSAFNCSVLKTNENEYWMAFRSSNYKILTTGSPTLTTESKIRNKLFLVKLIPETWQFDETTLKEINLHNIKSGIKRNIEDARLFWDGNNYCLSATFLEIDCPTARVCKVTLESLETAKPIKIEIYRSFTGAVEKNWMPIHKVSHQKDSKTDFIYKSDFLYSDGEFLPIEAPKTTRQFRGGSQVIPLEDGTSISVIHELYYKIYPYMNPATFAHYQSIRHYTHRFIRYDKNHQILQMSKKFIFIEEGIEFAAGIAEYQNSFIVSFGRSDIASYMATIDKNIVFELLEDIDG